jgi:chorismate synthase
MLNFQTSGESHGPALVGIVTGLPAGVPIEAEFIDHEIWRRQQGYGRGGRMTIEQDRAELLSGVRHKLSLGSPISFMIANRDHKNWQEIMKAGECALLETRQVTAPRPGHADLPGAIKYHHRDMRNVLERASARETAARVAAGAIFKQFLALFNIYIYSQVIAIGAVSCQGREVDLSNWELLQEDLKASAVHCADPAATQAMIAAIDAARLEGESLGGCFEVGAVGVPPGLGSYVSWDTKLDAALAALLMSIPAIKAAEIGDGVLNAKRTGSQVHDEIFHDTKHGIYRRTNRAGGLEGGVSNGETVWARGYMKPIPTLYKPLHSVDTRMWEETRASVERSDICAVPAAAVVAEAMMAFGIARAFLEKFSGDHVEQVWNCYDSYSKYMKKVWQWEKI